MKTHPTLDRESFERLLANAFAVQRSQLDRHSLSAIVEIQRLIQSGKLDLDGTSHLIADCARNVADATGICIGLLKGNQLVFRAGSGSGAAYVGQHVMASLTVSADTNTSGEILRVENAQADTRIDAAICRQFGAEALLILPIYHDRTVAGVLEILFSEPHAFQDRELRTYRLMAGLIGEVMSHAVQLEQETNPTIGVPPNSHANEQIAFHSEKVLKDAGPVPVQAEEDAIYQPSEIIMGGTRKARGLSYVTALVTVIIQQGERVFRQPRRWNMAVAGGVAALVIACWIAYKPHRVASPLPSSARPGSVSVEQQPVVPAKMLPSLTTPKLQATAIRRRHGRVGNTEVEYIGDDVTVRHFTPKPARNRVWVRSNEVHQIGDDVTVRYLTPKPSIVQAKQPVVR